MTAEEFERRYHFKPSDEVLRNMNDPQESPKGKDWVARHSNYHVTAHIPVLRITETGMRTDSVEIKDWITYVSVFNSNGQLDLSVLYIDMEE